jgi:hypothetical protein
MVVKTTIGWATVRVGKPEIGTGRHECLQHSHPKQILPNLHSFVGLFVGLFGGKKGKEGGLFFVIPLANAPSCP